MPAYPVPAAEVRAEIEVMHSRFIACLAPAFSVHQARDFIARVKAEHPAANHHVSAYQIGYGASIIQHCTDDGEPPGTAGRPVLAVLQGSGLGDVAVVVTRYFGGTKLGVGGLVRAYGDAVRAVLAVTPRARKILTCTVMISLPYSWFERLRLLAAAHSAEILDQDFGVDVTLTLRLPSDQLPDFQDSLRELTQATLHAELIETTETIFPISENRP
jgi:uncharacterized YigZ family protein